MLKEFKIDWDSLGDCYWALNELKSRIAQLRSKNDSDFESRGAKVKRIFETCLAIYNHDITSVYRDMKLDDSPIYYVYLHCDPGVNIALKREGKSTFAATLGAPYMPFYVGKGTGDRVYDLNRNDSHRKVRQKIKMFNGDVVPFIVRDDLTECEALMLESKLIDIFGLRSYGGLLVNLDEGVNHQERRSLYSDQLKELNKFYKEAFKS